MVTLAEEPQPLGLKRSEQIAQSLVRALLYAVPALLCAYAACVSDPDLWWHLRTGEWIVDHHAVPLTDPFSTFGAGKPWAAYSWLFDILILQLFRHFGLLGMVIYTTAMVLAITVALHHMIKRLQADFSIGVLLTFVAALSLWRLDSPRPWHFTILFFVLELDILMQARRTGRVRELVCLPVLFALWANVHIQFIDGLLLLALATAESLAATWWPAAKTRLPLLPILSIFLACIVAALLNPYGWKIYGVAHELAAQPGVLDSLAELKAILFRNASDYCVLALALTAAAALARSPRLRVFEIIALAAAVFLSFRSQRDIWLTAAIASAIIATCIGDSASKSGLAPRKLVVYLWPVIILTTSLLLIAGFRVLHVDDARLKTRLENDLPARAAAFALEKHFPGPLYNDYPWGGYLMWSLRQPVSIDGRAALHGTERLRRFGTTWNAAPDWRSDPELQSARLVIGPVEAPLTQLLRQDSGFHLVYEDKLAAVFIRQ